MVRKVDIMSFLSKNWIRIVRVDISRFCVETALGCISFCREIAVEF